MNDDDRVFMVANAEELRAAGVKTRSGNDPNSRDYDILERFLRVPNHAMFLFTSEDRIIDGYLRDHWDALDGLSGDFCDIHVSILQLQGGEDAYSQLDDLRRISGLGKLQPTDLPALHIWSRCAWITLQLSSFDDESRLKRILRAVFSLVRNSNGPIADEQVRELSALVNATNNDRLVQKIEVHMGAEYNISGGQQGAVGDNARATDFTQTWNAMGKQIDLKALALELENLRANLGREASTPEHFIALSEVAAAESAATRDDGPAVLQHLKKAGTWVWDVATKIGIGVATAAVKVAIGL